MHQDFITNGVSVIITNPKQIICECGGTVIDNKTRHEKSKKHQKYVEDLNKTQQNKFTKYIFVKYILLQVLILLDN